MTSEIIVALLALVGTCVGSITGVLTANKLTNYKIDQLSKRVDKHNSVVERTYALEKDVAIIKEQLKEENQ